MKMKKFLIASGNPTLLVWGCPPAQKKKVIKFYLGKVEQVGFISTKNNTPVLEMMGNELCINATLAIASQLGPEGKLIASGIEQNVSFKNVNRTTEITLSLPYKKKADIVLFSGIGFLFTSNKIKKSKSLFKQQCSKYRLPAFGAVTLEGNKIAPFVYVNETDSLLQESAYDSGSIAANIFTGLSKIKQLSGGTITVKRANYEFIVSTDVTELRI